MLMMERQKLDLRARFDRLREIDWDFATSDSQSSFSSLHWHPCRYPSQVPAVVIGALSSPSETIFDPFLGSGTTAVEAQRLSRRCIGIEINPVAALMARAKTINRPATQISRLLEKSTPWRSSDDKASINSAKRAGKEVVHRAHPQRPPQIALLHRWPRWRLAADRRDRIFCNSSAGLQRDASLGLCLRQYSSERRL